MPLESQISMEEQGKAVYKTFEQEQILPAIGHFALGLLPM